MTDAPYTISDAPYTILPAPSTTGYKTRAARLIGDGLNCKYVNRSGGYTASPTKVKRFEQLYAQGWDASVMTGALIPPNPIARVEVLTLCPV